MPQPFDNETLADLDNVHAQDAKTKLKGRIDSEFIGITCEGEVRVGWLMRLYETIKYYSLMLDSTIK